MIKHILGVSFTFLVSGLVILFPFIHSSQDELSAVEAVEKINRKIQSTPEMENWQATVLSTIHEMDKSWQSKKKIVWLFYLGFTCAGEALQAGELNYILDELNEALAA